ncbi:diguanylate cyclase [Sphingomonas sp. TREG-RG-20F-R18-01]|uniref:sensor domain-containing diguanylate cyclase n=1 Tax=Sphingomonas sp. TREG-RG-20F-R18-01 TaxID=2914982 RepID=UPI001F587A5B|nr:diguanylate cyclase [Sphingomonas sp. TREG-RG-20F-R18-01]
MRVALLSCCALILAVIGSILLAADPAAAQAGVTGQPIQTCVLRDQPGITPAAMLAGRVHFDCPEDQRVLGRGTYWVLSPPLRWSGPVAVRSASLWQGLVTLHALYADGHVVSVNIDQRGASRRMQLGAILEVPLPPHDAPLVRLLWHVDQAANLRGIVRDATLARPRESIASNLLMGGMYAAFAGLCIALLCYNFALWVALRHPFQLAYCAMVLGLLAYAVSSSGWLAWLVPDIANNDRIRINYLLLGLSTIAAFAFARTFFEARVFAGGIGRLVMLTCAITAAASLAFCLFAPLDIWLFDRIYSLAFAAQMAMVIPLLWRAWVRRSNYLWVFTIAWGSPIIMAAFRIASSLGMIGWNFWLDNSTILTMTIEALLSSIAIAYRMRLLSIERDEAREREIAARLLADIDPLTGLLNRRAFLHQAIGREGAQILMIADLDHFKQVNETIGHDGGDEVLRVFARTLRQSVPAEALVARIGGEEFAIVIGAETAVDPDDILARLRAGRMPYDVTVTASIGMCVGSLQRETDWKALYACSDRALFDAKSAGRDRARSRALDPNCAAPATTPLVAIRN